MSDEQAIGVIEYTSITKEEYEAHIKKVAAAQDEFFREIKARGEIKDRTTTRSKTKSKAKTRDRSKAKNKNTDKVKKPKGRKRNKSTKQVTL
jgi:predicted transposase YdaD